MESLPTYGYKGIKAILVWDWWPAIIYYGGLILNVFFSFLHFSIACLQHQPYLVLHASPSYTKREKGSGQKGHTNASGWNAIIGNSGVREIETNCHFRTYTTCTGQAHARKLRTTHNYIPLISCDHGSATWLGHNICTSRTRKCDHFEQTLSRVRVHEGGWAQD